MTREGPVSGRRWNRITDSGVRYFQEAFASSYEALLADGFPPFHEPNSPLRQFQILSAARAAGDPLYWDDPQAQQTYARLAIRFADPGPALPTQSVYPGGLR